MEKGSLLDVVCTLDVDFLTVVYLLGRGKVSGRRKGFPGPHSRQRPRIRT